MTFQGVLSFLLAALASYLVGAIPFGLLLGRALRGVDIREHGSRNLGATNAFRVLGAPIGATVFVLDFAKGLIPTLSAAALAETYASPAEFAPWIALTAALSAVLGHVFPIYLGLRGGKGVATGAGALAALAPIPTAIAFALFASVVATTRYVSLGSILAALALPLALFATVGKAALHERLPALLASSAIAVLVTARHRENLVRLLSGTERRLGAPAASESETAAAQSPAPDSPPKVGP
ncbi:MAG TPA: glycerol-3-phosphate 1-O-acyltransferase PlsY [Planctomycetota bacterium]|nr:glycerol-3-phosphate 1-O-acyltransferase PlsY [Planctomycetota bacterium]